MRSLIDADDAYADRVSISESNVFCNLPCLWRRRSISRSRPVSHVPWLTRPPTLTSSALWLCPSESRPICCSSNSDVEGCVGNSCIPVCRPIAPDRHREFVLPRLAVENRQAVLRRSGIDSADADPEGLERVGPSHRPSATGSTSARETDPESSRTRRRVAEDSGRRPGDEGREVGSASRYNVSGKRWGGAERFGASARWQRATARGHFRRTARACCRIVKREY